MARITTTSGLLVKLLNDSSFTAGINKAMEITQRPKHYESLFMVEKIVGDSKFAYPPEIDIGNVDEVGGFVNASGFERLEKEFLESYGRNPKLDSDELWEKFLAEKASIGEGVSEPYPEHKGANILLLDKLAEPFLELHIHPENSAHPSQDDFDSLRENLGSTPDYGAVGMIVAAQPITGSNRHNFCMYRGKHISLESYTASILFGIPMLGDTRLVSGIYIPASGKFKFHAYQDGARKATAAKKVLRVFD